MQWLDWLSYPYISCNTRKLNVPCEQCRLACPSTQSGLGLCYPFTEPLDTLATRKDFLEKKNKCHPNLASVVILVCISSCSTFVPSIIKIFCRVLMLPNRDKKSNSNTRRGDNSKSKKSQSHSCM